MSRGNRYTLSIHRPPYLCFRMHMTITTLLIALEPVVIGREVRFNRTGPTARLKMAPKSLHTCLL
eukprot:6197934-Pleurochrysis_carterae.AAC.1